MSNSEQLRNIRHIEPFPQRHSFSPLIAPLWSNFEPVTINYRVAEDPDTLQQVVDMIASRNPELTDYQPSLAVVVTVHEAQLSLKRLVLDCNLTIIIAH